jgi:hypothetical protein
VPIERLFGLGRSEPSSPAATAASTANRWTWVTVAATAVRAGSDAATETGLRVTVRKRT